MTYRQYELYREESGGLVQAFEDAYQLILSSNLDYSGKRDVLISDLDDLINVTYEDLIAQSNAAVSQLEAVAGDFHLKTVARNILSAISTTITTSRDSAIAARVVRYYCSTNVTFTYNL